MTPDTDEQRMRSELEVIINIPNAVSMIRLLLAPIMLALAFFQLPGLFLAAAFFSGVTDVLDGFLARTLNQITEFGSHLDSWGDFTVYSCMAIGAWILWPDIVLQELYWFLAIVISLTLPVIIGLIKFRALTSYHTWSVKLAVLLTFIGYLALFGSLFGEYSSWLFHIATIASVIAGLEEIAITLFMHHQRVDIRTAWQAWQFHKAGE